MYRYRQSRRAVAGFKQNIALVRRATTGRFSGSCRASAKGQAFTSLAPDFSDQTWDAVPFSMGWSADPKWPLPRRQHRFYAPYWSLCPSALGCAHGHARPLWRLAY